VFRRGIAEMVDLLAKKESKCKDPRAYGTFVRRFEKSVRKNAYLWGKVGGGFMDLERYADARRWHADFASRHDVQPYMMMNYAFSCRAVGNVPDALAAHRFGLSLK